MLTAKENMIECMKGSKGHPDRFVNQYEAVHLLFSPYDLFHNPLPSPGDVNIVNPWGVTNSFPVGVPGAFPVHTPDKIVIKDIEHWQDYVHAPNLDYPDEEWATAQELFDKVDGSKSFKAIFIYPGLFEQSHHLSEITNALINYVEYEDEMHDLLKYLTEWELQRAELICARLHPDMLFHHDDWGSQDSTFMSVPMFEDFLLEPYKEIYGYYKSHGVDYVVHHSDSYAATLVPHMIEMGIDVFQGCMRTNKVEELLPKYRDQITFMGCIDNKLVDFEGWTDENCERVMRETCDTYGMHNFIPCIAQGGPGSVFPGVYMSMTNALDRYNMEKFGVGDPAEQREEIQIMF